jgi:hypothetical protein
MFTIDFGFYCHIALKDGPDSRLVFQMTADGDGHGPCAIGISDPDNGNGRIFLSPDQVGDVVKAFRPSYVSIFTMELGCQKQLGTKLVLQRANDILKMSIVDADDGTQVARTIPLTEEDIKMFVQAGTAFQRDLYAMSECPHPEATAKEVTLT